MSPVPSSLGLVSRGLGGADVRRVGDAVLGAFFAAMSAAIVEGRVEAGNHPEANCPAADIAGGTSRFKRESALPKQ